MTNEWYLSSNVGLVKLWDGRNGRVVLCSVSPEDVPAIDAVSTTWYAQFARKSRTKMYATGKVWNAEDKKSTTVLMHRVIMGVGDPAIEIDHRDNDGLNNQRGNLRPCSHAENMRFQNPGRDWAEVDRRRDAAAEYRQERAIARAIAAEHGITRQALWKIRMQPGIGSPAAVAYRAAIEAAGVRSLLAMQQATDGTATSPKFGLFRSGGYDR